MGLEFLTYFNILIGGIVLFYGIKGTGKLYETQDIPKEALPEYQLLLRKFCLIAGAPMLVLAILELVNQNTPVGNTIAIINIFYVLTCVVIFIIFHRKKFGKYLSNPKAPRK